MPVAALRALLSLGLGGLVGIASWQFSLAFPFWITPEAAKATYIPARFSYNALESHFCESPWTIYTDYALGVVMVCLSTKIFNSGAHATAYDKNISSIGRNTSVRRLRNLCVALMSLYAVQFSVAGVLHQFLGSIESRNTLFFRFFWTIVVTMVSASGGIIGAIGSELAGAGPGLPSKFIPNDLFWIGYTILVVGVTFAGLISYQRPAADTFIAGTSQAMPTFFLIGQVVLMGDMGKKLKIAAAPKSSSSTAAAQDEILNISGQVWCILGFLMNSLLLPGYALTLYHTDISIPVINTAMHSWLCLCYTLQGLSLSNIVRLVFANQEGRPKQK